MVVAVLNRQKQTKRYTGMITNRFQQLNAVKGHVAVCVSFHCQHCCIVVLLWCRQRQDCSFLFDVVVVFKIFHAAKVEQGKM